jgi:DNA-binding LytR/AlgR family response regulator
MSSDRGGEGGPARLRALVVEDEWPARRYLVDMLQASALVDVVAAVETLEEARLALGPQGVEVDVVFLDLDLATSGGERAGLALAREASASAATLARAVVITTALGQHAVEAFELGVVDYLLKPFDEERVARCLERVRERLRPGVERHRPERVVARHRRALVFLRIEEAWAFEASGRLTFVHTARGRFDVDLSLAALESSLATRFARVHRNWLVNVEHIRSLERDDETALVVGGDLSGHPAGLRVPVSRERAQAVRELLLEGTTGLRRR